jgi:hypothetical protein
LGLREEKEVEFHGAPQLLGSRPFSVFANMALR